MIKNSSNTVQIFFRKLLLTPAFLFIVVLSITGLFSAHSFGHGVISSSATVTTRANNLVEIKIQFNLQTLLNNTEKKYSLTQLAALSDKEFGKLYYDIISIFDSGLKVTVDNSVVKLNKRYPAEKQVQGLIKREFIESRMSDAAKNNIPYTYDERRHYQVFYFGFKVKSSKELDTLKIDFPTALGDLYVTYSASRTSVLHEKESWLQ